MINQELYIPKQVKIASIKSESPLVKSYQLKVRTEFKPGQFVQASVLGTGEVPISISSSPADKGFLELTVRKTGKVTGGIHNLKKDDFMGLRGPYGNSFPIDEALKKDLLFVAGGIGLAPLACLIRFCLSRPKDYGRIFLAYGARTAEEMIFKGVLKKWQELKGMSVFLTVDQAQARWKGNVGVVTTLLDKLKVDAKRTVAFVCGPPIMIKYTIERLLDLGLRDSDIIATLERYMKCGVGKCGHCYLVNKYVCTDGPVFSYQQLKDLKPVEELLV